MTQLIRRLLHEDSGQDIIEYALVAAGIAVLLIPTVPLLGQTLLALYQRINGAIVSIP